VGNLGGRPPTVKLLGSASLGLELAGVAHAEPRAYP
jgi:hypothetical protein